MAWAEDRFYGVRYPALKSAALLRGCGVLEGIAGGGGLPDGTEDSVELVRDGSTAVVLRLAERTIFAPEGSRFG